MTPSQLADDRPPLILGPLHSSLLDLLFELREAPLPLTVGGGFGLYLKRRGTWNRAAAGYEIAVGVLGKL